MKRLLSLRVACFLVAAGPCLASEQSPIFDRLGRHYFKITTRLPAAQRSFDRGITLVYGYERARGEKEFLTATAADPTCAIAWWGGALSKGPNINLPKPSPQKAKNAW